MTIREPYKGRGGKRIPGEGKTLGRTPIDPNTRRIKLTFSIPLEIKEQLELLGKDKHKWLEEAVLKDAELFKKLAEEKNQENNE